MAWILLARQPGAMAGEGELWGSVSFQLAEQTLPDPSQLHGGAAKERLSESSAQRGSGDTVRGELGAQKMGSREGVRYVQRWETFMCRPSLIKRLWSLLAELGHGNANPRLPRSFLRQQGETRPLASPTLAQLAPGPHMRLAVPLPRFPSSRALSSSVLSPSIGKAASSIVSQGGKRTPSSQYLPTKFPDRLLSPGHESGARFGTGSRGLRVTGCTDWPGLGCVPALGLGGVGWVGGLSVSLSQMTECQEGQEFHRGNLGGRCLKKGCGLGPLTAVPSD